MRDTPCLCGGVAKCAGAWPSPLGGELSLQHQVEQARSGGGQAGSLCSVRFGRRVEVQLGLVLEEQGVRCSQA